VTVQELKQPIVDEVAAIDEDLWRCVCVATCRHASNNALM